MNKPHAKYTFDELTEFSNKRLGELMRAGSTPKIEEMVDYEFRGYNMPRVTKLTGTRKYKKGFYAQPGAKDYAWGYNMPVVQNRKTEPWLTTPNEENPRRYYFFKLLPAGTPGYDKRFAHALIIDYSKWDEYFFLHPARFTLDYLVYPDPENHDLVVGRSDFSNGPIRFFLGYLILERHNKNNYQPQQKI